MLQKLRSTIRHAHPGLEAQFGATLDAEIEQIAKERAAIREIVRSFETCATENRRRANNEPMDADTAAAHRRHADDQVKTANTIRELFRQRTGVVIP